MTPDHKIAWPGRAGGIFEITVGDLRAWADNPAAAVGAGNPMVPVHPDTLRALADWLEKAGEGTSTSREPAERTSLLSALKSLEPLRTNGHHTTPLASKGASNEPVAQIMAEHDGMEHGRCIEPLKGWELLPIGTLLYTSEGGAPAVPTAAARDVLAERCRQVEAEGWTPEHDDEHDAGELAAAACAYAALAADQLHPMSQGDGGEEVPTWWPWEPASWKPSDPRRNLIKAGALILAEIERLDRVEGVAP